MKEGHKESQTERVIEKENKQTEKDGKTDSERTRAWRNSLKYDIPK